jgi:hypothetical protein
LKLHTLILDKNELSSLADFPAMPTLDTLWINNNQFKDLKQTMDTIEKNVRKEDTRIHTGHAPLLAHPLTSLSPVVRLCVCCAVSFRM